MKRFLLFFFLISLGFVGARAAHAATAVYLNADVWTVGVGQETHVRVSVDSDASVNAFRVVIQYPIDLLEYADWNNGGSIISHWVSEPKAHNGTITFEGVVPGGFSGTNGLLATFVFRGVLPGIGWIHVMPDSQVLLNDGQGTPGQYVPKDMRFRVVNAAEAGTPIPYDSLFKDTVPPEPFVPLVARDPGMFGGKWFVTFETQDKDSGVDHYDIAENVLSCDFVAPGAWREEQSPYVLSDQSLHSYICVRAVDKAGNTRIESVSPQGVSGYAGPNPWVILGIVLFAVAIVGFNIVKRNMHHET